MESNMLISFFCAVVSSTVGCVIGCFFNIKSLRFLIVDWLLLVFAFTFFMALLTFQDDGIKFKINFIAPLLIPHYSYTRWVPQVEVSRVDYLVVGVSLAVICWFFGWRAVQIVLSLQSFEIGFKESFVALASGSLFCLSVSIWALKKFAAH